MNKETRSLDGISSNFDEANQNYAELGTSRVDSLDERIAATDELAENLANALVAAEVKREREKNQGMSDDEAEAAADAWLKTAGFDDLTDPDLK